MFKEFIETDRDNKVLIISGIAGALALVSLILICLDSKLGDTVILKPNVVDHVTKTYYIDGKMRTINFDVVKNGTKLEVENVHEKN